MAALREIPEAATWGWPMQKFDPAIVGDRLRLAREALGLQQVDVCNTIGVSTSAWNRFEKGERLVKPEVAYAFGQAYGFDLNFIFTGSELALSLETRKALAETRRRHSA